MKTAPRPCQGIFSKTMTDSHIPALSPTYINDLPEHVDSTVHLFADDTVLYLTINSQNSSLQLQTVLNNLEV